MGTPTSAAQAADDLHLLLDGLVGHFQPGDDVGLVHLFAAGLHHADGVGRAGHHQIDGALVDLLVGGVDHPGTVDLGHPHRAHRAPERGFGQAQSRRGARQGQHVVGIVLVHGEHRGHDVRLFVEALGPQRPDGPIDEPRVQDGLIAGPAFFLDEAAGDLARGVHPRLPRPP